MSIIERQIKHLNSLKDDIEEIAKGIVEQHKEEIISVLQDNQLGLGYNSRGRRLKHSEGSGYYAPETENYWAKANPPIKEKNTGEPYNFEWSGSFFEGMIIKQSENSYSIWSIDGKTEMLQRIYGDILTLTKENNYWINKNIIEPELYKYVLENLFKFN